MSARIRRHIRSNVVGYIAIFLFAIGGTSYATHPGGADTISSEDIINGQVFSADVRNDTIVSGDVRDDTLASGGLGGVDIAPGAISTSEVINGTLSASDLGSNSVGYAEIAPDAFNTEFEDSGFFYGIANDSIQSNEVTDNSLTGSDIATNSLTGTDIDETTLSALDGNDAHDQSCDPETATFLRCVELSFTAGQPMPVLMMATYQYHGVDDNPLGRCRTTLDGATISIAKLYNSDHTSEIGGSQVDVVGVDAGSHTFGIDCIEDGPDNHDLIVTNIDLAEVQLGID